MQTMAAHKDLESRHAEVQQQHSDASGKASTCQQDLAQANKRCHLLTALSMHLTCLYPDVGQSYVPNQHKSSIVVE